VPRRVATALRVRSSSPRECLYADGLPPTGSASWCSPTQSSGASTPRLSQHRWFPICRFFHGRLTMDRHLRPFPGPAAAAKTSASTLRTSSTTSLASVTNGLTPHQRCPPSDSRRWCKSYLGELPAPPYRSTHRPRTTSSTGVAGFGRCRPPWGTSSPIPSSGLPAQVVAGP
jgi:hypothetical protein